MKIFHYLSPSANVRNLQALAECMGISCELVEAMNYDCLVKGLDELALVEQSAAILDITSLRLAMNPTQLQETATALKKLPVKLLFLTTAVDGSTDQILHIFTHGAIVAATPGGTPERVSFPKAARKWSRELAGHSYKRHGNESLSLRMNSEFETNVIVELETSPTFICFSMGRAQVFVWSASQIMDPLRPLLAEIEFENSTDQYIPAIIFLLSALGERCWHNPDASAAIVIDDPLLKRNYGFIRFPQLLNSARKHGYRVTIAFIPWNSWRSRLGHVQLFREYQDCFSICAHGCDHTNNEYGSIDYDSLLGKNIVAAKRMERHLKRTGILCESVMVCPQERYSLEAMHAFSDSNEFLALVNTSCLPRNLSSPQVRAADLLFPAQDFFYGFPVFKRHYWTDMSPFAMDRFLGKPAILVEHHEFFRDGCAGAEHFASQLSQWNPAIEWKPVSDIVASTHSQRQVNKQERAVRFFAKRFRLRHVGETVTYHFSKRIPESVTMQQVLVNGAPCPFSRKSDMIFFDVRADTPRTIDVQVETVVRRPAKAYSFELNYQAGVAIRRVLSEFRDNVISKNDAALRMGKSLVRAIKAGDNAHNSPKGS